MCMNNYEEAKQKRNFFPSIASFRLRESADYFLLVRVGSVLNVQFDAFEKQLVASK